MRVEQIHRVIDASELSATEDRTSVDRHEVADCTLRLGKPIAFDPADVSPSTGRFVIVDDFEISGGGIVREAVADDQAWVRDKVLERNYKWDESAVSADRRVERYSQKPMLVIVTGSRETDRKGFARQLEAKLFGDGRLVYFLGMGNVLYGVDADIERTAANRLEHLRRLGEVANILLDAGLIVVAAAAELTEEDAATVRTSVGADRTLTIWIGDGVTTDLRVDAALSERDAHDGGVNRAKRLLLDTGAIFRA
jgi:bifunctional enzyme CysN/CysC